MLDVTERWQTIELFLFGFASVVDVALLFVIFERVNRANVAFWLKTLVASTAFIHTSIFIRLMIVDVNTLPSSIDHLDRLLVIAICGGLLALPSAMLHAVIRLNRTGILANPPLDQRYGLLYLPLLALPLIAREVWQSDTSDFLTHVGDWKTAFLVWLVVANSASILGFLRLRGRHSVAGGDAFLRRLSIVLVFMTSVSLAYAFVSAGTPYESPLRLVATLSPLAAGLLFVWHSLRGRVLPLIMERTVGYAVIFVGLLLLHRLAVTPLVRMMGAKTNIDFVWIEGILIASVVLVVPSLRRRVGESLRYLLSTNVGQVRDAMRGLALRLAQNGSNDRDELLTWFADDLRRSLDLDHVTLVLNDDRGDAQDSFASTLVRASSSGTTTDSDASLSESLCRIHHALSDEIDVLQRGVVTSTELEDAMISENALLAIRLSFGSTCGTVVVGNRYRNDRLSNDQIVVLSLIIDQFAATLHNRLEQNLRQQTQRKVLQQEKLSVLGLLAGSLAHELRNPMSSIRTITTLVIEDLGPDNECSAELKMVVDEIDRLTQTTNQLLGFAKPDLELCERISPDQTISRIVCILSYLAKQFDVELTTQLDGNGATLTATESSFTEIVFNLTKNAIEAARDVDGGHVSLSSTIDVHDFVLSVCDNGPGIATEKRKTLFQPFVTGKPDGNGLGLFAVAERVRELGGTIDFRDNQPCGAAFEIRLSIDRHSLNKTSP